MPAGGLFPGLMVFTETSNDAAVVRLNDEQAIVATTDFFMPLVDDHYDFGRIAASNARSKPRLPSQKPVGPELGAAARCQVPSL